MKLETEDLPLRKGESVDFVQASPSRLWYRFLCGFMIVPVQQEAEPTKENGESCPNGPAEDGHTAGCPCHQNQ